MKTTINFLIISLIMLSCEQKTNHTLVTKRSDYLEYLALDTTEMEKQVSNLWKEVEFWENKIEKQPNGFLYIDKLATTHNQLFEVTGDISHLSTIDSLYNIATGITGGKWKTAYQIALASNAIKRHEFKHSLEYGYTANQNADEQFGPLMMLFDAYMELGYYESAYHVLRDNKRFDSFDYLVRLSKYQDHTGDLDSAIMLMETAYDLVKNRNSDITLWAQTNLADMYGHAGKLEDSYRNYLQVLKKDKDYRHALKGIAWLAYANDNNLSEAQNIIEELNKRTQLPDDHIMLAEMAEFKQDKAMKEKHLSIFMNEATKPKYGGMYNKYLITLMAEEYRQFDEAIELAQKEIENRATPLTYSLLAWSYELKGEHDQAFKIAKEHVAGKTFEPQILYYLGVIYLSNDQVSEGRNYLQEASEASFELGPVVAQRIRDL